MWSIGCILGEMLLGKPLFPGTSTVNQIEQILRIIPPPSAEGLNSQKLNEVEINVAAFHSDYRASIISRLSSQQRVTLEDILPPSTPPQALDLLKRLLVFNPDKRLTAEEALKHPYVQRFHCPTKEPALDYNVILPLDDDLQLSVAEYRNKLYEIILERKAANRHQKQQQQLQRKDLQPRSSEPRLPPEPPRTEQGVLQPLPPSTSPGPPGAAVPCEAAHQSAGEIRRLCPRPTTSSTAWNLIAHNSANSSLWPGILARNRSAPFASHQAPSSVDRRPGRPASWAPANHPTPAAGTKELHGNPKTSEAHHKEVPPIPKPSRKMFHVTANVGAAGDPRACLGSYSQSYGTISLDGFTDDKKFLSLMVEIMEDYGKHLHHEELPSDSDP
ncbi:UNVERIFIED_CONTAM: hypothetical protein K2H54_000318 [Gekko kuhli]